MCLCDRDFYPGYIAGFMQIHVLNILWSLPNPCMIFLQIQNGNGMVTLWKKHITKTYENILNLVGRSMYVSVSVLTESGKRHYI